MKTDAAGRTRISTNRLIAWAIAFGVVFVIAISMVASSSNADPTDVAAGSQSLVTSITNASVIVFREGLEAVLIFAAITASFLGARRHYRKPVTMGVAAAFAATVVTWFIMTALVGSLPVSEDVLLAITGIGAVVILLLVMNWFFHKIYWTDHIKELNTKKRDLVDASETGESIKFWGFFALGFTAVYREGFEVVLFLQNLNIVAGTAAVMWGVLIGLAGTTVVGFLTFFLHHKLPYKRMLVLTGVLLGIVLVVMVGGSARTLQSLGVLSTTPLPVSTPDWWARWFEIVPTWETVGIQLLAAAFVVGSYYGAEWWSKEKRRRARMQAQAAAPVPAREPVSAEAVLATTAALPQLARTAPSVAGSPAAVRSVARVASATDVPRTICGLPAMTLCGSDATRPVAARTLESTSPIAPPVPAPVAHALVPRPLFEHAAPVAISGRPALFAPRVRIGDQPVE